MAMIITIAKGVFVCFCSLIFSMAHTSGFKYCTCTLALHALGKEEFVVPKLSQQADNT